MVLRHVGRAPVILSIVALPGHGHGIRLVAQSRSWTTLRNIQRLMTAVAPYYMGFGWRTSVGICRGVLVTREVFKLNVNLRRGLGLGLYLTWTSDVVWQVPSVKESAGIFLLGQGGLKAREATLSQMPRAASLPLGLAFKLTFVECASSSFSILRA